MSSQGDRGHLSLQPVVQDREELLLPYHLSERVIRPRDEMQIERGAILKRRKKQIAKLDPQVIVLREHEQHLLARALDGAETPEHARMERGQSIVRGPEHLFADVARADAPQHSVVALAREEAAPRVQLAQFLYIA